jgi:hypothetical protein
MERQISWKSPKILVVLTCSLLALLVLLIVAQKVNAPVVFLDPNLEQAIREKVGKPVQPIYRTDLMSVIELDAAGRDIQRLEGIEALRRLAVLNLSDNIVVDLEPLARLRMLKVLHLANNQIGDLSAVHFDDIKHLRLRELDLEGNQIANIKPIRDLTSLEHLNLRDNAVTDLEPLAGLTGLVYLNIHSNPVESGITILGNFTRLETLIMRNVYIGESHSFLENLNRLNRLNIRNTGITDISMLGKLMAAGTLQDNPEMGVAVDINLLEINPIGNGEDPYHALRQFWGNINTRYPIILPHFPSPVQPPQFSHESGFYKEAFYLTLTTNEPGARIFYTLDGSEPALTPQLEPLPSTYEYLKPIFIEKKGFNNQSISNIETTVMNTYPNKDIDDIFIANVIRAYAIEPDSERSNVITHTYFIDEHMAERYSMPIVSITTNPEFLFDNEIGIYVPGDLYQDINPESEWWNPANYSQRGLKWERPIFFQMFNQTGDLLISQNLGVRIHGGATRYLPQKSLRLYAKTEYDQKTSINYDFFPALNNRLTSNSVDIFESLIIRNSGNDWVISKRWRSTMFKDALSQSLLEHTKLDIQGYQPVIVFLNGEYWGIHNVRTRYDEFYFNSYYSIEPSDLIVLEGDFGSLLFGSPGDESSYRDLLKLIDENYKENGFQTSSSLRDQSLFDYFVTWIDIENFITYNLSQIYFNNTNWEGSNIRFWRKNSDPTLNESSIYGHDGKWRFMILDTDFGFFNPQYNTINYATRKVSTISFLLRSLLENEDFKIQFINTFADHLNTTFREEVVTEQIDSFEDLYSPEVDEHIRRWGNMGGSFDAWLDNVQSMRDFANLRPFYQRQHIIEYFGLTGLFNLCIQTDPSQGYIRVNSIDILESSVGISDPSNWSGIYFQNVPIEITALPHDGYQFVGWEGLGQTTVETNSPQITVNSIEDLMVIALFEKK